MLCLRQWEVCERVKKLTADNYYKDTSFLSFSQIVDFVGTPAMRGCEARALAKLSGEYRETPSDALILGSLIDVMLTGTEEEQKAFMADHPEMYASRGKTTGQLLAKYAIAEKMIQRLLGNDLTRKTLSGEHQRIFTGKIFGYDFKCKVDSLLPYAVVDLKSTADIGKSYFNPETRRACNFMEFRNYALQGAIYQALVEQNTGKKLPFFITAVDKHADYPDIDVFQIDQGSMDAALEEAEPYIERIVALKNGEEIPERCECCAYCRMTKNPTAPRSWLDLGGVLE